MRKILFKIFSGWLGLKSCQIQEFQPFRTSRPIEWCFRIQPRIVLNLPMPMMNDVTHCFFQSRFDDQRDQRRLQLGCRRTTAVQDRSQLCIEANHGRPASSRSRRRTRRCSTTAVALQHPPGEQPRELPHPGTRSARRARRLRHPTRGRKTSSRRCSGSGKNRPRTTRARTPRVRGTRSG